MTAQNNIEHFNRVVLVALDRLYDAFPVPIELNVANLAESATPGVLPSGPGFKELQPTFESIKFLSKEGFLQYSDHWMDGTAFLQVQLTLKGLTVLGQVPDSLKPSLISQVKSTLKSGAKAATADAAKQVVGQIFTAAATAAPVIVSAVMK